MNVVLECKIKELVPTAPTFQLVVKRRSNMSVHHQLYIARNNELLAEVEPGDLPLPPESGASFFHIDNPKDESTWKEVCYVDNLDPHNDRPMYVCVIDPNKNYFRIGYLQIGYTTRGHSCIARELHTRDDENFIGILTPTYDGIVVLFWHAAVLAAGALYYALCERGLTFPRSITKPTEMKKEE